MRNAEARWSWSARRPGGNSHSPSESAPASSRAWSRCPTSPGVPAAANSSIHSSSATSGSSPASAALA
ncbi:hypothetical protein ACIBH1_31330 [Nonomuraea sp. NPDC050663]|uniref:hypothetical protein n=1 Tax=Nonomuraea sp. NPDC050663 TaxID=3364370 RepID=UPI00378796D8